MDGHREPRDLYTDPKKIDPSQQSTVPSVKRPRQKGLHFDLGNVQPPSRGDCPELSMPVHGIANYGSSWEAVDVGFFPGVATPAEVGPWCRELAPFPRRDTPVPDTDMEGIMDSEDAMSLDEPPMDIPIMHPVRPPTGMQQWLGKHPIQRPLQPMERYVQRKPKEESQSMVMGHPPFPMETMEDRIASSPFSAARMERDRFMEMMTAPRPPPAFDPHIRPTMVMMPPPPTRKFPPQAGSLFAEEDGYESFAPGFVAKDWNGKEAEAALAGQRLRQPRRSRAPGPNREPDLGPYFARPNGLFDFGYSTDPDRNAGRISVMRERLRRLEQRHSPLEDNREQESRGTLDRHRARQPSRDRRAPCRGGEFGALMNALGLVPDDDISGQARDGSSNISRMREAVFGIVNSRLPPHLLFSDRDFDGDDYEFLSRLDDSVESKKGADDQMINKIDLCAFGPGMPCSAIETEPRCPICLENFAEGVEIRVMPCQHKYHRCCLDKWLKIKAVCPICNMNIKDKFLAESGHGCI